MLTAFYKAASNIYLELRSRKAVNLKLDNAIIIVDEFTATTLDFFAAFDELKHDLTVLALLFLHS